MKKVILISMLFAMTASYAQTNGISSFNSDLKGVWSLSISHVYNGKVLSTTSNVYYFFSDFTFLVAPFAQSYSDILQVRPKLSSKWKILNNNLILFNSHGEQIMTVFSKNNTDKIISGSKIIKGTHELNENEILKETSNWLVSLL